MTYQLSRDGQTFGPYTIEDLQRYLDTGNVQLTDYALGEGMSDWITVAQLLQRSAPPPPPPGVVYQQPLNWSTQGTQATFASGDLPVSQLYPFFPVTVMKFVVMSLVTLGLYQVYWAYMNWARIKVQDGSSVMPWARAIFLGIWNFPLFERVHSRAAADEVPAAWNHIVLGVLVLLFGVASRLPNGIAMISLLSFLAYLPVIGTIARINARYTGSVAEPPNDKFSGANIAGIVVGTLILILAVIGFASEMK